jgi:hypothetical protein
MELNVGAAVGRAAGADARMQESSVAGWREQMEAERKTYFEVASAERSAAISAAISDQISQVWAM